MASVVISGDTSGAVTITAPAVAGTPTLTLPTTTGTLATLTTPSFTTTIGVGGATASASGSGISFPATQSSSSDANTLDDYEEGTWTPADSSGASLTFTSVQAFYTKTGRMVTLNASFTYPSTASTAQISIGGVPFAYSFSGAENCMTIFDNAGLGANQVYFATTSFDIRTAGTNTLRTNANFSLKRIHVMISYSTSA